MSALRFGRIQKATALVPLALLSTAWTASLLGTGGATAASSTSLPDGTMVPIEALEDPASFSVPGNIGLGVEEGDGAKIVAAASTNAIPAAALAAYQRAETVINAADASCHIDWQLIAAIGRVESDHGRYNGNVLDSHGVSHPGIYGIPLDGTKGTQSISDTDAGQYDNDKVWDRAVGAMQFIPSTWSTVGVDADGDGKRNPQDIDDSALATAVYLCSGDDDLGTDAGRRTAVFRYNHSQAYVDLVLQVREAYLAGDFTAVPNYVTSAYTFSPPETYAPVGDGKTGTSKTGSTKTGSKTGTGTKDNDGTQTPDGSNQTPDDDPTQPPTSPTPSPTPIATEKPVTDAVKDGPLAPVLTPITEPLEDAVNTTLTLTQATLECTAKGYSAILTPAKWKTCMAGYGF